MNYPLGSNDWYACVGPDNPNTENSQIGLREIKEHNKDFMYPYYPCCYKENQYTKKKSHLREYIEREMKNFRQSKEYNKITKPSFKMQNLATNIMNVHIKANGVIQLPNFINDIFLQQGMKYINKEKQVTKYTEYLIFSLGSSYESFFHCIALMLNKQFIYFSNMRKNDYIMTEIRNKILEFENFNFAKQELFEFSDEEIRKKISTMNSYIDPKLFYSFFKKLTGVNLIMIEATNLNTNGFVTFPNFHGFYINPIYERDENFAIIMIVFDEETNKYYCNPIINIDRLSGFDLQMKYIFDAKNIYVQKLLYFYNIYNKNFFLDNDFNFQQIKYYRYL
jgi:hypothetical protein